MEFSGRVAVVTGAAQGIGLAVSRRLSSGGAAVALLDRQAETVARIAAEFRGQGARIYAAEVDVADAQSVADATEGIRAELGAPDILVNNAGFDRPGTLLKTTMDDFEAVLSVHLTGALNMIRALAPAMIDNGYGRIVNVSSIYGKIGAKGEGAYVSAKAAIIGLTKVAAREMGAHGVLVNAVLPGLTDTPTIREKMAPKYREMIVAETALKRMAQPEEVAEAIVFLASERASFITGAALEVSGGWGL